MIGRSVIAPYELPIELIVGIVGKYPFHCHYILQAEVWKKSVVFKLPQIKNMRVMEAGKGGKYSDAEEQLIKLGPGCSLWQFWRWRGSPLYAL